MVVAAPEVPDRTDAMWRVQGQCLLNEPTSGLYFFCGSRLHIPKGVTLFYGMDRKAGRLVERIREYERNSQLSIFQMWQTGIIEDGIEKRWDRNRYEPSCEFANVFQRAIILRQTTDINEWLRRIYDTVIVPLFGTMSPIHSFRWEEFAAGIDTVSLMEDIHRTLCMHCGIAFCLNRRVPFRDQKLFTKIIRSPKSVTEL